MRTLLTCGLSVADESGDSKTEAALIVSAIQDFLTEGDPICGMICCGTILRLSEALTDAIQTAADLSGKSADALVEEVLSAAFLHGGDRFVLRLADALKDDFAKARSWPELQGRLRLRGVDLRRHDAVLCIADLPGSAILCPIDDLGETENRLAQRFGRQFPTASLAWFFDAGSDEPETDPQNADRVAMVAQAASG